MRVYNGELSIGEFCKLNEISDISIDMSTGCNISFKHNDTGATFKFNCIIGDDWLKIPCDVVSILEDLGIDMSKYIKTK